MELIALILAGTLLIGSILGIVSFKMVSDQRREVRHLRWRVEQLAQGTEPAGDQSSEPENRPVEKSPQATPPPDRDEITRDQAQERPAEASSASTLQPAAATRSLPRRESNPALAKFMTQMRANWMVWLGGVSLGLAGIFLVIYSIEQGLLGPTARILLGLVAGITLQVVAEYLRRRLKESNQVFAALAAAGAITLFASIYAAFELYDLISANTAFVGLAFVGVTTMALALLHGPVLAGLGLLGAYTVPILVSTDSGNIVAALIYTLIITGSAAALLKFIYRPWLWWGIVFGGLSWWLLTLDMYNADAFRGIYLAINAYIILAVPRFDWLLNSPVRQAGESYSPRTWLAIPEGMDRNTALFALLTITALGMSSLADSDPQDQFMIWLPGLVVFTLAARSKESLNITPWLTVLGAFGCILWANVESYDERVRLVTLDSESTGPVVTLLVILSLCSIVTGFVYEKALRFKSIWASYATLPTALALATGYLLLDIYAGQWALAAMIVGIVYLVIATSAVERTLARDSAMLLWLFFAGHFALGTAAAIALTPDTLTLVIAAQLITTAWLMERFSVDLSWMIKVLATILIVRLTLNPWLISYPTDEHWTLWTYGGSALLTAIAWWTLKKDASDYAVTARKWLEGATLHLVVLALWTELRYWVYDGVVFEEDLTSLEVALNVILFGAISVVYYMRSQVSESLGWLYRAFSLGAAAIATLSYTTILGATLLSFKWVYDDIGSTPIWNLGLLYYGVPIVVAYAVYRLGHPTLTSGARWLAASGLFIFLNLQIRHLWNGTYDFSERIGQGEMVTISIVWLVLAVAGLVFASIRSSTTFYKMAMLLLAVTIAKIFLVDMSDLTGLLRVLSFMGLGLALLGLQFLHQRLVPDDPKATQG